MLLSIVRGLDAWTALLGAALLWSATASAQQRALLMGEVGGEPGIAAQARAEALRVARELLEAEEWAVEEGSGCVPGQPAFRQCAADLVDARLSTSVVDAVVGLVLFSDEGETEPSRVVVTMVGLGGASFPGEATRTGGRTFTAAVRDAVRVALSALAVGTGPHLTLRGTTGARCTRLDDGELLGVVPLANHRLEPGFYRMRCELAGHRPVELSFVMEESAQGRTEVAVELASEGGGGTPGAGGGADWALPVGIAAIVAGLGVGIVPPVVSEVTAGCAQQAGGVCVRANELDVGAAIAWAVAGGVLTVAGVVVVIVGATSGGGGVQARLGAGSVALEGRFR